jgi:hypothetical protein
MKNGNPKNYKSINRVDSVGYQNGLLRRKMFRYGKNNGYDKTYDWIFTLTEVDADNYYYNSIDSMRKDLVELLNNSDIS